MITIKHLFSVSLLAILLYIPTGQTLTTDPTTLRTIQQGSIIGTRGRDNAKAWYGIPYAQAPVANLRFRAPRTASAFTASPFVATDLSKLCTQYNDDATALIGSEDCLYLNISAPAQSTSQSSLPVMLWIHGGANLAGYASQFEMGKLANSQNVIVVSINYRLGPLGWLSQTALRQTAQISNDNAANFALLDIIESLDWVAANISEFGGDPSNITVFGESAGGANTAAVVASPLAAGKFHKAIIQSGYFDTVNLTQAEFGPQTGEKRYGYAANEVITQLETMTNTDTSSFNNNQLAQWLRGEAVSNTAITGVTSVDIFEAYRLLSIGGNAPLFGPNISFLQLINDGVSLPTNGILGAYANTADYNDVPIIIGTTKDELRILGFLNPALTGNLFGIIYFPLNNNLYTLHGDILSELWRAHRSHRPADILLNGGNLNIYNFKFDWDEQGTTISNWSLLMGAAHGLEQAFITGGFDDPILDPIGASFTAANQTTRELLSEQMMSYWAHFAYTGNPSQGRNNNLPLWSAWSIQSSTPKTMIFDTVQGGGVRMINEQVSVNDVLTDLANDTRANNNQDRCFVVEEANKAYPFLENELSGAQATYCP